MGRRCPALRGCRRRRSRPSPSSAKSSWGSRRPSCRRLRHCGSPECTDCRKRSSSAIRYTTRRRCRWPQTNPSSTLKSVADSRRPPCPGRSRPSSPGYTACRKRNNTLTRCIARRRCRSRRRRPSPSSAKWVSGNRGPQFRARSRPWSPGYTACRKRNSTLTRCTARRRCRSLRRHPSPSLGRSASGNRGPRLLVRYRFWSLECTACLRRSSPSW
jgi:hypothetical protein